MRIEPGSLVYGVAPKILQACAQYIRYEDDITFDKFCEALTAPASEARPILDAMIADGYITPLEAVNGIERFKPNNNVLAGLALASVSHGIARADAEKLVEGILLNAAYINTHLEEFSGIRIKTLAVFGSYLTDKPILGDIDIGYYLQEIVMGKSKDYRDNYREYQKSCKHLLRFLIRRKHREISLHIMDELIEFKHTYEIIYEYDDAPKKTHPCLE